MTDVKSFGVEPEDLLSLALSIVSKSDHPLADAIVRYARGEKRQGARGHGFR